MTEKARRSTPGFRLHATSLKKGGSIGMTLFGKYTFAGISSQKIRFEEPGRTLVARF